MNNIFLCGSSKLLNLLLPIFQENGDYEKLIIIASDEQEEVTFKGKFHLVRNQHDTEEVILKNYDSLNDFLISAYWPWKFTKKIVDIFPKNSINFHPSPLPKDRGWYPHVHQIRENTSSGVTLHKISEELDEGEIWAQNTFNLPFPITSGQAYEILTKEIVNLFYENWDNIRNSKIKSKIQNGNGNFLSKYAIKTPEIKNISVEDENLLRLLSSRNVGNKSYIKIRSSSGIEKFIHITYSENGLI